MRARDCGFDDAFAWLSERTGWGPAVAINLEPRKTIVINGVTADAETGEIIDETGECAITDVYFDGDAPPAPVPLLIERLLPREGLTFLGGQSGAGKSFVAIDMSAALSSEQRFFDYNIIERCAVIYVAAEGGATVPARLAAAKKARDMAENLPVAVIRSVPDLANANQRKAFIAKLRAVAARLHAKSELRVGCVMLDTLAAAFGIKDENSAGEMNAVCKAAAELGASIGAATVALAHYGKAQETGLRGSSAQRAAGESVLAVLADRDENSGRCSNRRLAHVKSRIGEEGPIAGFELRDIWLSDAEGGEFKASYVEVGARLCDADQNARPAKGARLSDSGRAFLDALQKQPAPAAAAASLSLTCRRLSPSIESAFGKSSTPGGRLMATKRRRPRPGASNSIEA